MKRLFCLCLILISSCSSYKKDMKIQHEIAVNSIFAAEFVEGTDDIPLADGMQKIDGEENLNFDLPSGNIIAISYRSDSRLNEIKDFYIDTLPQMGWVSVDNDIANNSKINFKRDGEKLEIEFVKEKGGNMVKFYATL